MKKIIIRSVEKSRVSDSVKSRWHLYKVPAELWVVANSFEIEDDTPIDVLHDSMEERMDNLAINAPEFWWDWIIC